MSKLILVSIVLMASMNVETTPWNIGGHKYSSGFVGRRVHITSSKPKNEMTIDEQIEFYTLALDSIETTAFHKSRMRAMKGQHNTSQHKERVKAKLKMLKLMKKRQNKKK